MSYVNLNELYLTKIAMKLPSNCLSRFLITHAKKLVEPQNRFWLKLAKGSCIT